ncbi:hypothetical protein M0R45_030388 [Rubus argutus]|uniref:Uncharacterized protein n=1 Tax=Rubus argutus TaxID=59490 RepID=A0AAW1WD06_RUBAR
MEPVLLSPFSASLFMPQTITKQLLCPNHTVSPNLHSNPASIRLHQPHNHSHIAPVLCPSHFPITTITNSSTMEPCLFNKSPSQQPFKSLHIPSRDHVTTTSFQTSSPNSRPLPPLPPIHHHLISHEFCNHHRSIMASQSHSSQATPPSIMVRAHQKPHIISSTPINLQSPCSIQTRYFLCISA